MSIQNMFDLIDYTYRGVNYAMRVRIKQEDGTTDLDLTGCTTELCLADYPGGPVVLTLPGSIIDAPTGRVQFEFTPENTADLVSKAYHMMIFVSFGEETWPAMDGKFGILPTAEQ